MLQMSCNGLSPLLINFCKNGIPLVETKKNLRQYEFYQAENSLYATELRSVSAMFRFLMFHKCPNHPCTKVPHRLEMANNSS